MEEKLKEIFDKEYSTSKLEDFTIKTQKVYEILNYDFKLKSRNFTTNESIGGKVWLNEKYTLLPISNITILTFESVYPNLISKICNTNLENFNIVFSKLLELYSTNKDTSLKEYINSTYGCLQNKQSIIYSNNIHLVPKKMTSLFNEILKEFESNIIYVDTDQIFFRNFEEIEHIFESTMIRLNKYELPYFYEKSKFGLFKSKKSYIIEENSNIRIKGMNHYNKDGISRGGKICL